MHIHKFIYIYKKKAHGKLSRFKSDWVHLHNVTASLMQLKTGIKAAGSSLKLQTKCEIPSVSHVSFISQHLCQDVETNRIQQMNEQWKTGQFEAIVLYLEKDVTVGVSVRPETVAVPGAAEN